MLDDWAGIPAFEVPVRDDAVGADPPARARLGWDREHLYLALEVPDDSLRFPERSWRYGDGFYLTVLMPGGGEASAEHISFGFSRVGDRLERVVVNRSGEYFPQVSVSEVRFAMRPTPEDLPVPGAGPVTAPGPVRYEAAVPWSLLMPAHPLVTESVAINIVTVDSDGGERRFGMLAPDPGFDTERTPVRRGRLLPVLRRPGSAVPALVVMPASAVASLAEPPTVRVATRQPTASTSGAGPTTGPRIRLELLQGPTVVAAALVEPEQGSGGIRRALARLEPGPEAGTGPARLMAHWEGTDETVEGELFLVDRPELRSLATELEAIETDPAESESRREAVASAMLRLHRLAELPDRAPSNAALEEPARWWDEARSMVDALRSGGTGLPRTGGIHRLAHRSRLDGTLQPYSVQLPDDYDPHSPAPYPVLVALHGSGVDERGTLRTAGSVAAPRGWIVLAPRGRGLSDWYLGPAETDVLEALASVSRIFPIDTGRVALAGFSMGGYGAWRLGLRHGSRFHAVAILSGGACPPPPVDGPCVAEVLDRMTEGRDRLGEGPDRVAGAPSVGAVPPLLVVHGTLDQAVPVEDVRPLIEAARAVTTVEYREVTDAGHGQSGWWRWAVEWLEQQVRSR